MVVVGNDRSAAESAELLAFGASACLSRQTESRGVLNTTYLASRGLQVFPQVTSERRSSPAGGALPLTQREGEVLNLLRLGHPTARSC